MTYKAVVYCKNSGEQAIPLTVRIEWLPDGTIKPIMYWTPDNSCFRIIANMECIPLAFLRDRGEGLRFKVQSELIETPEPFSDLTNTQFETYIYLADNRFSERNIIDERYKHTGKEYVPVTLDVFPKGDYEIIHFSVRGERYLVEKTEAVEQRGSFQAGGVGLCHKVDVRLVNASDDDDPDPNKSIRRLASLYLELNKWFVKVAKPV